MSASTARVGAVIRKELAEFRRNRLIVVTAAVLPLVFLVSPRRLDPRHQGAGAEHRAGQAG